MINGNTHSDELRRLLQKLLPPDGNYHPVIKEQQQQEQLNTLNNMIADETFYFVFNLLTYEFDYVKGVERWLGYSDNEFTVGRYLHSISPGQRLQFNLIAQNMYRLLCKGIFKLKFNTQRYMSLVALKHYNGEYITFKKTTSVFQYDDKNRLLAQLDIFNKLGAYEGAPLNTRITETDGLQKDEFERRVFQMTLESFMEKKIFSPREFDILRCYANDKEINSNRLALLLNISPQTVATYNKRILEKAETTFTHSFTNAKEVALHLKKEKIIS